MGEIRVRGGGAEPLLQRLTPNDVAALAPGRAHYSGLLTERGTYVDDLLVYRLGAEDFMVVANASNAARDLDWIRSHAAPPGARAGAGGGVAPGAGEPAAEIVDQSDDYALLALQGPRALAILEPLASPGVADLRYYGFLQGEVAGAPALISRTGYTGEDGFELYLEPRRAAEVWRRLLADEIGRASCRERV